MNESEKPRTNDVQDLPVFINNERAVWMNIGYGGVRSLRRAATAMADVDDLLSPSLAWSPHHLPVSLRRSAQRSARAAQGVDCGTNRP